MIEKRIRIAILGGGPAGLYMYKRLVESGRTSIDIDIFEKNDHLGAGMPYSAEGANDEHDANVSGNEIPQLETSIKEWLTTASKDVLNRFDISIDNFSEFKVLPRLFLGEYLSSQFALLQNKAIKLGLKTHVHRNSNVIDVVDHPERDEVWVQCSENGSMKFDRVIISTGHHWPLINEGRIKGYYDSPYPPSKLKMKLNHPVAIKGASLTAIDAIKTIARSNGKFIEHGAGRITFQRSDDSPEFKVIMHSVEGLLPAVRFYLENTRQSGNALLSPAAITKNKEENDGFVSLDWVFDKFKESLKEKDRDFYREIKDMGLEEFVGLMMDRREHADPFQFFRAEYAEAERSIRRMEPIHWKELLAVLSFEMNYQAKYLSAEDMLRFTQVLMPLISIVIAFVPQNSGREILALHDAGVLELVSVDAESEVAPEEMGGITYSYKNDKGQARAVYYKTFINSTGQPKLSYEQFPFKSLLRDGVISPAMIKFRSRNKGRAAVTAGYQDVEAGEDGSYYLKVPGITINDNFQVVDEHGQYNKRIFIMAVPYIGGYNPDYSGLDFCAQASKHIIEKIFD